MLLARIALALVAFGPLANAQERESVVETYPDGSKRSEFEVVQEGDELVRDGKFASFYPDGSRASQGRYKAGVRHGTWKNWFTSGGRKRAEGKYFKGLKRGAWKVWLADGERNELESGVYTNPEVSYASGARRATGEALDGIPHGTWTLFWEHGPAQAVGTYRQGIQHGAWSFRHGDGVVDPSWISGVYENGARVGDIEPEGLALADESHEWPELPIEDTLADEEREAARRDLVRCLELEDPEAAHAAAKPLWRLGRHAAALFLAELGALDPGSVEDAARAANLEWFLLSPLAGNGLFGIKKPDTPELAYENEMSMRRWRSLLSLARVDPSFLAVEFALGAPRSDPEVPAQLAELPPPLRLPAFDDEGTPLFASATLRRRHAVRARLDKREFEEVHGAIERGLAWLAAHQSLSGGWSVGSFEGFGLREPCACDGEGEVHHFVGLTGVALLPLIADGNSPSSGPHRRAVALGVGFLLLQQDPGSGLFGRAEGLNFLYNHAAATQALIEAYQVSPSPVLAAAIEKALTVIEGARNPYGSWRYDLIPQGENDTSMTAWMLEALTLAREAGFTVPEGAFEGGTNWLDEATDSATGRTGYNTRGSQSARVSDVNEHYPRDHTEAMTAAALFSRLRMGQTSESDPIILKHADLLLRALPDWNPDGMIADFYYWYYASSGMSLLGGKHWKAWRESVERELLRGQRADTHAAGSWDPIGPWGFSTGRVGTTALAVLSLQSSYRFVAPPQGR